MKVPLILVHAKGAKENATFKRTPFNGMDENGKIMLKFLLEKFIATISWRTRKR